MSLKRKGIYGESQAVDLTSEQIISGWKRFKNSTLKIIEGDYDSTFTQGTLSSDITLTLPTTTGTLALNNGIYTGTVSLDDGTEDDPSLYFTGTTTGIFKSDSTTLGITCDAIERVLISDTETIFTNPLYLPTVGGTATGLDYYEEWSSLSINITKSGGGDFYSPTKTMDLHITRLGTLCTATWTRSEGSVASATYMLLPAGTVPSHLRPPNTIFLCSQMQSNSSKVIGVVSFGTDGSMIASAGTSGDAFSTLGLGVINSAGVSWIC